MRGAPEHQANMASAGVVHDGSISSELDIAVPAAIPIAIIGMSCKLPGEATSPERLWELCAEARGAWSKIPADRFNQEALYHPAGEKISTVGIYFFLTRKPKLTAYTVQCPRCTFYERGYSVV